MFCILCIYLQCILLGLIMTYFIYDTTLYRFKNLFLDDRQIYRILYIDVIYLIRTSTIININY